MKFKLLLWLLAKLLQRAVKKNAECARHVKDKTLVFQIQTLDGAGRHFRIDDGKVRSAAGLTDCPKFTLVFKDAAKGFAVLSAKESKDAFLTALRTEDLVIRGDFVEVLWFQRLTDFLQPQK
ncbi:helicase [Acidovorax sp. Root267]|uniref:hypothetical protein n=1 Tax=Acidovorax sp. Root267 TaxID=1736505 RepID=UPI00070BAE70|nr:hypothetical protein [Acidovorax sp. Root267]KRD18337.1 helicase [Acidovorax sp. Root267]